MAPTNDFGASFDVSDFISQKSFDVSSVWSTHTVLSPPVKGFKSNERTFYSTLKASRKWYFESFILYAKLHNILLLRDFLLCFHLQSFKSKNIE